MEERPSPLLSSDLSVARVKTCRSLARHGRRQDTAADLWSEAQVSWTCAVALEPSSSSSVLHELRLNQLSTLWRCTGAFVLTARDAARSTPELAGPNLENTQLQTAVADGRNVLGLPLRCRNHLSKAGAFH